MDEDYRRYARFTLVDKFFELAFKAYNNLLKIRTHVMNLKEQGTYEEEMIHEGQRYTREEFIEHIQISELNDKLDDETIICVIFICTFLEAYIWELGAIVFGDNYVKSHLEKLGTVSKWEIIPQLFSTNKITLSDQDLGTFRHLVKFRNSLIHHKSKDFRDVMERVDKGLENFEYIHESIDLGKVFSFIENLFIELDKIDPKGYHINALEFYKKLTSK